MSLPFRILKVPRSSTISGELKICSLANYLFTFMFSLNVIINELYHLYSSNLFSYHCSFHCLWNLCLWLPYEYLLELCLNQLFCLLCISTVCYDESILVYYKWILFKSCQKNFEVKRIFPVKYSARQNQEPWVKCYCLLIYIFKVLLTWCSSHQFSALLIRRYHRMMCMEISSAVFATNIFLLYRVKIKVTLLETEFNLL